MLSRIWTSQMTRSKCIRGWIFFLLYLLVFPYMNSWVQYMLLSEGESMAAEGAVFYYLFLFALCLLLFWSFLHHDFLDLLDWLPENCISVLVGLVFCSVLYTLFQLIPFPVTDVIPLQYRAEFSMAPWATLVLLLVLIPVVEETMFRGVVFGSLRSFSVPLAYVVTISIYALSMVWRYATDLHDFRYLLLAIRYLPMAAAYTWCYDNGGSVWACVVLHALVNGLMLFFILL